ncbi:hypothetical protein ES708_20523 [subsurface metagenome]
MSTLTIPKAIEILQELPDNIHNACDYEDEEALKLGIEALKKIQDIRTRFPTLMPELLPGEDPDDSAQSTFEHKAPKTIYHRAWAAKPTLLPSEDPE